MMEEELRSLLHQYGWGLRRRWRRNREYFYAQKWKAGEVYITSRTKLPDLTKEEVIQKLSAVS